MRGGRIGVALACALVCDAAASATSDTAGSIVVYRGPSIVGAALPCPVRHEGREIVELGRGKFAIWRVPAGRYLLVNRTSSLEVTVAPGEARYVRCRMKSDIANARADLQLVDQASFDEAEPHLRQKLVAAPSPSPR